MDSVHSIITEITLKAHNSVIRAASKVFPKKEYDYISVYNGRSLTIISKSEEENTRIYVRVMYRNHSKPVIDISSVSIDESKRRQGKFTSMINSLKKSRTIGEIWVSSVLTPEMESACKKLNMKLSEDIDGYKFKL